MELISAALAGHVDDASTGLAVLGTEFVGLHLELLYGSTEGVYSSHVSPSPPGMRPVTFTPSSITALNCARR